MGLASITPWIDGDATFMEEAANFFERSNLNKEIGRSISMKTRHFFRGFQPVKQLNEAAQSEFRQSVTQALTPLITSLNLVDQQVTVLTPPSNFNFRKLLENAESNRERRLMNQVTLLEQSVPLSNAQLIIPFSFRPSNPHSELIKGGYVDAANAHVRHELDKSPLLLNGRRLQSTIETNPLRVPQIQIPNAERTRYDLIGIHQRPLVSDSVYYEPPMFNIDQINKVVNPKHGMNLDYTLMSLTIPPESFVEILYSIRQPDRFSFAIDQLISTVQPIIVTKVEELMKIDFTINPVHFYLHFESNNPTRRLKLKKRGHDITANR